MISVLKVVRTVGYLALGFLSSIGRFILFTGYVLSVAVRPPFYLRQVLDQILGLGYFSLPIVGLATLFTGMALALQSHVGFSRFSTQGAVAAVVVLSMTRELAPVLTGIVIAGRVGASIATEIGAMRVTEQIDALMTLSTNPLQYLVTPRLIAGILTLPFLVLVGDAIGIFGGYLVSSYKFRVDHNSYLQQTLDYLGVIDIVSGLAKAAIFGFFVVLLGCYQGYTILQGGAYVVSSASTNAVVLATVTILMSNYILTALFFGIS